MNALFRLTVANLKSFIRDRAALFWTIAFPLIFVAGRRRVLVPLALFGFAVCILVMGFTESAVYALLDAFDKPATYVSVIVSVQGVGAVVGGLSSGWIIKRIGEVATRRGTDRGDGDLASETIGLDQRDLVVRVDGDDRRGARMAHDLQGDRCAVGKSC